MSKCVKCGKHGLFVMVNIRTGLCASCQKQYEKELTAPVAPAPVEKTIEIPTIYIGNDMKYARIKHFDDVELAKLDTFPDFSKIHCCDDVSFSSTGDGIIAKIYSEVIGRVVDESISKRITESLENKLPIFSQVLGYDDETGEIHIVVSFYKIVDYDYNDYAQERDDTLDNELVAYF